MEHGRGAFSQRSAADCSAEHYSNVVVKTSFAFSRLETHCLAVHLGRGKAGAPRTSTVCLSDHGLQSIVKHLMALAYLGLQSVGKHVLTLLRLLFRCVTCQESL